MIGWRYALLFASAVVLLGWSSTVEAQSDAASVQRAAPDSLEGVGAGVGEVLITPGEPIEQPEDSLLVPGGFAAPTWVMFRSFLIPGWGQARNGAWWKAVICAGIGAAFYERLFYEDRRVEHYRQQAASTSDGALRAYYESKVERHRGHRRDFIWWTALFLALCGGDAYVDAHLKGFEVKIQVAPEAGPAPPMDDGVAFPGGAPGIALRAALALPW